MNQTCIKLILNVCHANSTDRNHGFFQMVTIPRHPCARVSISSLWIVCYTFCVGVVICLFGIPRRSRSRRQMYHHIIIYHFFNVQIFPYTNDNIRFIINSALCRSISNGACTKIHNQLLFCSCVVCLHYH